MKTRARGAHPLPLRAAAAQSCGIRGFRLWPAIQHAEGWDLTGREALQEKKGERLGLKGSWSPLAASLSLRKNRGCLESKSPICML